MVLIFYQDSQAVKGEKKDKVMLWRRTRELGTENQDGYFDVDRQYVKGLAGNTSDPKPSAQAESEHVRCSFQSITTIELE